MNTSPIAMALAASLAAAFVAATPASAGPAAGQESCYGIALKGQNDCAAGNHSCAGQSKASYGKAEFKYVASGTCATMKVHGHKGSLTPA